MPSLLEANDWVLATQNPGKVKEFGQLLEPLSSRIRPALDELNVAETGSTFAANAQLKAQAYAQHYGVPALADDSGLMIEALGGNPGIYSARWALEAGGYPALFQKLEGQLKEVPLPKAAFICVLCLVVPGQSPQFFEGRLEGHLTFPPQGSHGFGYDPIFIPAGYDQTCAQLSADVKNAISHRRQALDLLLQALKA